MMKEFQVWASDSLGQLLRLEWEGPASDESSAIYSLLHELGHDADDADAYEGLVAIAVDIPPVVAHAPPQSLTAWGFRGMSTKESKASSHLPRLWRHHYSGVWIGYLLGPSDIPGHMRFEGRRVWSWSGGRLDCSELARDGVKSGDRLGVWTTADIMVDGSVEILPITTAVAEAARAQ